MTGEITNIREYYTHPELEPVDMDKLVTEALAPDGEPKVENS
jgi:hypothetical protein